MNIIALPVFLFVASILVTGLVRTYGIRKNILDMPSHRSLHHIPTPRGGGITFVLLFTAATLYLALRQLIPLSLFYALSGGLIVAIIGWMDDSNSVRPKWRAFIHLLAAIWAIYWLKGMIDFGIGGYLLGVISIVWCINLYNFMDGSDGLAGLEGLFISLCVAFALNLIGNLGLSLLCFSLASIIAGFLIWNWAPAKIFMGDVGSGYLGYLFSVLAIATANIHALPITCWLTIAGIFVCDATFTLAHRVYKGECWYESHRKHAYQRLVQNGFKHNTVAISVLLINLFILCPVALAIFLQYQWGLPISYVTLLGLFITWLVIVKKYKWN